MRNADFQVAVSYAQVVNQVLFDLWLFKDDIVCEFVEGTQVGCFDACEFYFACVLLEQVVEYACVVQVLGNRNLKNLVKAVSFAAEQADFVV